MRYDSKAREHGVVFNGIQHGLKGKQFPLFTHKVYGTFAMMPGETLADSIRRKRIQFNNAGIPMNKTNLFAWTDPSTPHFPAFLSINDN